MLLGKCSLRQTETFMFRRLLPLVCALGIVVGVSSAQPLPDRVPLRGTVVDEAGRPVPSAVLIIRRQDEIGPTAFWGAEVKADLNGRFVIPNAEVGRYFVSVDAEGYAPLPNFALDWKSGAPPTRLQVLRLTNFELRVVTSDGKPLSNAPLWLRLRGTEGVMRTERLQTDAQGKVTISKVVPAKYALVAVAASGIATRTGIQINSQTGGAEVRLTKGASLRIKVSDSEKTPLGSASLILFTQNPEEATRLGGETADPGDNWALVGEANVPQALVSRDGNGVLELKHLPPGSFSGRMLLSGYGTTPRELSLEDGKTTEWEVTFPKRPSATLTIHVKDASGNPVPNTRVALRFIQLASNGTFTDGENQIPDPNAPPDVPVAAYGTGNRVAQTDENGNCTLFPLSPGRFRVFASRPSEEDWMRAPVAPEGLPTDVALSVNGTNKMEVQVP